MNYTNEYYRKRTANIKYANSAVKGCLKKMHIHNYIPGQVIYNLGEYPNKNDHTPYRVRSRFDSEALRKRRRSDSDP